MDHNSQPNYIPPDTPNPWTQANKPTAQPGNNNGKDKKTKLIIIASIAGLLLAGGIVAFLLMSSQGGEVANNDNDTSEQNEVPESVRIENSRTAGSVTEFNTICDVGSITNAADFAKPYKIAAFSQTNHDRTWTPVTLDSSAEYSVSASEPESTNVIACLSEKEGSASKTNTCEFRSGGQGINVDYYSLEYNLALHEAKTGKKIKDLGVVKGTADECPTSAIFSPSNPQIYASPDSAEINSALSRFVEEN